MVAGRALPATSAAVSEPPPRALASAATPRIPGTARPAPWIAQNQVPLPRSVRIRARAGMRGLPGEEGGGRREEEKG